MTRLDVVRQFFIERFIDALAADPRLVGLSHPQEVFDGQGAFAVSADVNGFKSIPTYKNLLDRINAATAGKEHDDLQTFLNILLGATSQLVEGTGTITLAQLQQFAEHYAPQVRQGTTQKFVPMPVEQYLNYQDGTLAAQLYSPTGRTPLAGRIYDVLFENPLIPQLSKIPSAPYQARDTFAATIGIDPNVAAPYPNSSLDVGQLNLSAADPRLGPGQVKPTLYAELKSLPEALSLNRAYEDAAASGGRFAPLRNNRIHNDPLINLSDETTAANAPPAPGVFASPVRGFDPDRPLPAALKGGRLMRRALRSSRLKTHEVHKTLSDLRLTLNEKANKLGLSAIHLTAAVEEFARAKMGSVSYVPGQGPYLLVYHLFYPADDNARRMGNTSVTAKNREGHHLATGILFGGDRGEAKARVGLNPAFLFYCQGPDAVRMIPFNHPSLQRLNDHGDPDQQGSHTVMYTTAANLQASGLTIQNYPESGSGPNLPPVGNASGNKGAVMGTVFSLYGVAAALAPLWPVGTVIAIALAVIASILWLWCALTSCGDDGGSSRSGNPAPGVKKSSLQSDPQYQDPGSYLAPGNTAVPGRSFQVELIPHLLERNLYGLNGGGSKTFTIDEDPALKEMLGWVAFPAGLGYQSNREFPGKMDQPGSSWRNYFELFTEKYLNVLKAQGLVTYFGA